MLARILSEGVPRGRNQRSPRNLAGESQEDPFIRTAVFGLHVLALLPQLRLILIGALLPVAMVTYYSIAESLAEYTRQLLSG